MRGLLSLHAQDSFLCLQKQGCEKVRGKYLTVAMISIRESNNQ